MPDLIDSATKTDASVTPPTGGGTPDPKAVPETGEGGTTPNAPSADGASSATGAGANGSPDKKPVDIEAAVAAALSATREADAAKTEAKTAGERATALEAELAKVKPALELLSAGKRAEAIKALIEKVDDDLLVDLAKLLPPDAVEGAGDKKDPTVQELAEAAARKIIEDEKAANKKAEDDKKKTDDEAQAAADRRELDTYKERAANDLKAALADGKFPFIADYGCDEGSFIRHLREAVEKTGKLPEPGEVLAAVEAEHESRWKKSRFAPRAPEREKTFEELVAETHADNKDALPYTPPPDFDDERAALARMDSERRNRRDWRA
jgi:hypothetical protein